MTESIGGAVKGAGHLRPSPLMAPLKIGVLDAARIADDGIVNRPETIDVVSGPIPDLYLKPEIVDPPHPLGDRQLSEDHFCARGETEVGDHCVLTGLAHLPARPRACVRRRQLLSCDWPRSRVGVPLSPGWHGCSRRSPAAA
jgi:hypothetical protein